MLTSLLALLMGVGSTIEMTSSFPKVTTTRNDYDYIGSNITCAVA